MGLEETTKVVMAGVTGRTITVKAVSTTHSISRPRKLGFAALRMICRPLPTLKLFNLRTGHGSNVVWSPA